jgi:aminopeptidase
MQDPRIAELARILVTYSMAVQPGELVLIAGEESAKPLALEVYRQVLRAGGHPLLRLEPDEAQEILLREGSEAQLRWVNPVSLYQAEHVAAYVSIHAPANLKAHSSIDPQRIVWMRAAMWPVREILLRKRWVVTQFPTPALAQEAEMSLAEYEDFLFGATNRDWQALSAALHEWKRILEAGREIRIVGPGTDLTLSVAGRTWIPADGKHNMPDGEIFTGPVEDSARGYITFDYPAIYLGKEVDGIRLEFEHGKVVKASASKNEDFLLATLDADAGARYLGELGIGTNFGITRFTRSILFDEKIGGTVHLAIGRSYPETGGRNESTVHWDMIKDLRRGGALYLDGELIQQDGRFVIGPELPQS